MGSTQTQEVIVEPKAITDIPAVTKRKSICWQSDHLSGNRNEKEASDECSTSVKTSTSTFAQPGSSILKKSKTNQSSIGTNGAKCKTHEVSPSKQPLIETELRANDSVGSLLNEAPAKGLPSNIKKVTTTSIVLSSKSSTRTFVSAITTTATITPTPSSTTTAPAAATPPISVTTKLLKTCDETPSSGTVTKPPLAWSGGKPLEEPIKTFSKSFNTPTTKAAASSIRAINNNKTTQKSQDLPEVTASATALTTTSVNTIRTTETPLVMSTTITTRTTTIAPLRSTMATSGRPPPTINRSPNIANGSKLTSPNSTIAPIVTIRPFLTTAMTSVDKGDRASAASISASEAKASIPKSYTHTTVINATLSSSSPSTPASSSGSAAVIKTPMTVVTTSESARVIDEVKGEKPQIKMATISTTTTPAATITTALQTIHPTRVIKKPILTGDVKAVPTALPLTSATPISTTTTTTSVLTPVTGVETQTKSTSSAITPKTVVESETAKAASMNEKQNAQKYREQQQQQQKQSDATPTTIIKSTQPDVTKTQIKTSNTQSLGKK